MPRICHVEITPATEMPRVIREAVAARDAGYQVDIVGEGENAVVEGITFYGFPETESRFHRAFIRSRKMVEKAIELDADIVQLHSPELLLYTRKLRRANIKIVFDCHEFYAIQIKTKEYIPQMIRGAVSWAYNIFERCVCKKIDGFLYPCTYNGKNLFENRSKRVLKIENYPIHRDVNFEDADKQTGTVVYAGGLTENRGITKLAEAVNRVDGARLVLCGSFSSDEYKAQILDHSEGKIIYKGLLNREELYKTYSESQIGICVLQPVGQYANLDNMPTKIYEYMQCGLPVVMSDFRCNSYWNDRYKFGICVNPENIEEIVDAIQFLLDHPEEARQMGRNGSDAVKKVFNWNVEVKKLLDMYEDILKN